ncbi:MAG: hypothetical protein AcusKO_20250 [Acuticoccus sp.]
MVRALIVGALALAAGSALAQDAPAPAPAGASETVARETAPPTHSTEIDRLRADFRARFVDYDARLAALGRRIEALEAELAAKAAPAGKPDTEAGANAAAD